MFTRRKFTASAAALAALQLAAPAARTQSTTWPIRSIKFVVPLTPGGANDYMARLFAERLQSVFGQPVVVENRPGVGGNIGTDYVAKQPPDGYTLLLSANTHVINPSFFTKLPYDPLKDFEPISLVGTIPFVLTVNAATPVNNLKEFLALARAKPGAVTFGTAGIGTPHHLAAELLKSMTGVDMVHVPYKGAAGIVPALLSGEITCTIGAINSLLPHIKSGETACAGHCSRHPHTEPARRTDHRRGGPARIQHRRLVRRSGAGRDTPYCHRPPQYRDQQIRT